MNWKMWFVIVFGIGVLASSLSFAFQGGQETPVTGLVQVTDHVWAWIAETDDSSNGALFVGDDAALLVDLGRTPEVAGRFLAAVRQVTDRPIRMAVLTHWHPDHSWGALCMPDREFPLLAHGKTRRALAEGYSRLVAEQPSDACTPKLPEEVVEGRLVVDLGSHKIEIFHPETAHTEGDLVVWSPEERVMATGDLFLRDSAPFMEEGSVQGWAEALAGLARLSATKFIPGHFAVSGRDSFQRFRAYVDALIVGAERELAKGTPPDEVARRIDLSQFADFKEYPQYLATFAANAAKTARELAGGAPKRGTTAGFEIVGVIEAGENPHQIAFSPDGKSAFVAAAASDWIAEIDVATREVKAKHPAPGTPLGVAVPSDGGSLLATRFSSTSIDRYRLPSFEDLGHADVEAGASLFFGPLPLGGYLVSVERADTVRWIDAETLKTVKSFPTGRRPFPPAATSDGRLAFVPSYDDGRVTIVDLWNSRVLDSVLVGDRPSGGAVLPGDKEYAVAVRGENRLVFLNTASHQITGDLGEGIGDSPFSVVLSPDGRLAFVNNTASHDISVIALPEKIVVARIPVGAIPIVMAVHPSGDRLWVSSEGSHEVTVISIPERWRAQPPANSGEITEVQVLGMIHGGHRDSPKWGLEQVREAIRRYRPDVVCAEIPPDRWERVWSDYAERGVIEDDRVRVFPEYVDALLPLKMELGFEVEPCAAWTREMADLRQERLRQFETDPKWAERKAEYEGKLRQIRERQAALRNGEEEDDPRYIHTALYDERTREELSLYDEYLNEWLGPGGWTNINESHMRLIEASIDRHPGKRILITFGAGHKYWILDHLRTRTDVRLVAPEF